VLFLTITLNFISSYLICSIFSSLAIFFITFFAIIILNSEILSLLSGFNEKNIFIISIINFVFSFIFWFKFKKKLYFPNIKNELIKIKNSFLLDKSLFFLLFPFVLMLLSFLILAFYSPVLEPDCKTYHFVRVFNYLKQENFLHFSTNEVRNLIFPINSEIIYSYFYAFKKNDTGFGFLSYFSYISLLFSSFLLLKEFRISTRKILFYLFTLSSFGILLVQIPSLQTDIIISSLIISSIFLFVSSINKNKISLLYFSSLAYALALGTKTTAITCFLSFLILISTYLFLYKKNFKNLIKFFVFLILNFLIFSSYNYILNFLEFKNFISNQNLIIDHKTNNGFAEIVYNFIYISGDIIGFKIGYLADILEKIQNSILISLNIQPQIINSKNLFDERTVGFSFLGLFYFFPCLVVSFLKNKNIKAKLVLMSSSLFVLNFFLICFQFEYSKYIIRYFLTFFILSSFCLLYVYDNKYWKKLIVFLCCINLITYSFNSSRCPLKKFFNINLLKYKTVKEQLIKKVKIAPFLEDELALAFSFKNYFKKSDKIAILNDDSFYEIKQLYEYNVNFITIHELADKNYISNFDYIILKNFEQLSNNFLEINSNPNLECKYLAKQFSNKTVPYLESCKIKEEVITNLGYKKIYPMGFKKVYAYQKSE